MIKKISLLFCCALISLSTHAQWWKKSPVIIRSPLLNEAKGNMLDFEKAKMLTCSNKNIVPFAIGRSQYSYDVAEAAVMKSLYHSLRFRITADILKGFGNLIKLYLDQNRYSEAKWYLLQYNLIGRQHNDNTAIVFSLINLGLLKADIGDFTQAREDLLEARGICISKGRFLDLIEIEKKLIQIEDKRFLNLKNDIRYAAIVADTQIKPLSK